jgi:hypothetical protein
MFTHINVWGKLLIQLNSESGEVDFFARDNLLNNFNRLSRQNRRHRWSKGADPECEVF